MSTFRTLTIEKSASKGTLSLLQNNVIGTPGRGLLYKLLNVEDKIKQLINPYFISVIRNDKVMGTCCFDERKINVTDKHFKAFYVRYFSFASAFRRKSVRLKARQSNSLIKSEIKDLLNGTGLVHDQLEKFLFYAYVDMDNDRSRVLCEEFGFRSIGSFKALLFSRLRPKRNNNVEKIASRQELESLLSSYYEKFNLVDLNMANPDNYYVIKHEGEIVAGVQSSREHWSILDIPGLSGQFILRLLPKIPLLNRFFNQDYYFLSFDSIFVKPGHEKQLLSLMSHLLKEAGIKVGSLCLDVKNPLYHEIGKLNLGFMNRLKSDMVHQVIAKTINFDESEFRKLKEAPVYISSFDVT